MRYGYRRMFRRQEDAHLSEVCEVLKAVPLFEGFSRSALYALGGVMHARRYKRDEFLYYEHDPGLGLYVVQRGRVRLLTEDENGNVHELRQANVHDFFGEISILGDFRRMETAQAVTETDVLGFFSPDLKTMLKRNPRLATEVVMSLARHLATQQVDLTQQVAKDEGKVSALRRWSESHRQAG